MTKSIGNALLMLFFSFTINCFSQDTISPKLIKPVSSWAHKNIAGIDLSEIAFMNWSSGGVNSISGLIKGNFILTYSKDNIKWVEELIIRYGVNKQDGIPIRKTDDALRYNSTIGYRKDSTSNWYHSAKFTFNTQFTNGYRYPNRDVAISKLFAPAYTFLGAGAEYSSQNKDVNLYISPITMKNTLVLDQRLANQGAFGVNKAIYDVYGNLISKGKKSKTELGFLITNYFKKEIFKNINLENRLSLYSDYINNFGNIDVDCNAQLNLVVNQYVKANIGTHFVYDDDIKSKKEINGVQETVGAKLQLKQVLGVGLEYVF